MYYNYNPIAPENRKTMLWLSFLSIAIVVTAFEAPYSYALKVEIKEHNLWWDGLFSLIFFADIILRITNKLNLPEKSKQDLSDDRPVEKPYYRTPWLPIDVITSLPIDIMAHFLGLSLPATVLNGIRLIRLIRIVKLRFILDIFDFIPKYIKVLIVITCALTIVHWIACGWMLLAPRTDLDDYSFYNISLYWTITTLTTVGYGDITPQTNISRLYTMGVMLFGVSIFGLLISNFFRMMMLADKYTQERKEKMHNIQEFMKYYNIPHGLQKQVFSFYSHLLTQNITKEDSKVVKELPQALQQELNIYMKIKLIKDLHIFQKCSTPCLKMIAGKLEQTFHSPNELIISKGDVGDEMFIIGHGKVQVSTGEKVMAELKAGQFFGEIALIEDTIRTADVITKAYCDLYILSKKDFDEVVTKYPYLLERFKEKYQRRVSDNLKATAKKKAA